MADAQRYTSESAMWLVEEADSFLKDMGETDTIAELLDRVQDLPDELRPQVDELAKLISVTQDDHQELEPLKCDASFTISAAEDDMVLCLTIQPAVAGGRAVTVEAVLEWLKEHEAGEGADLEAIRQAVEAAERGEEVAGTQILRGRPPKPGQDGCLEFFGRLAPDAPLEIIQSDQAGAGSDQALWLCQAGDRIGRCVPPTDGEVGYNVWHRKLRLPKSEQAHLEAGRGVEADGEDFVAGIAGVVSLRRGRLTVEERLVLVNDVTRQDGTVEFDGVVDVRAGVLGGAVIRATGDILVSGAVEDAVIVSTGGDVDLKHGVAGRNRGLIQAKGDVRAKFAENVTIQAGRDICISVGTMRCNLAAGRQVLVNRGRGQLFGGVTAAGELVEAKCIGAAADVRTEIIVGLDLATMTKLSTLDTEAARLAATREQASELADRFCRAIGDPLKLRPEEIERYKELRRTQLVVDLKLKLLEDQRQKLLTDQTQLHGGRVRILRHAMPNVTVSIGDAKLKVHEALGACSLVYDSQRGAIVQAA